MMSHIQFFLQAVKFGIITSQKFIVYNYFFENWSRNGAIFDSDLQHATTVMTILTDVT